MHPSWPQSGSCELLPASRPALLRIIESNLRDERRMPTNALIRNWQQQTRQQAYSYTEEDADTEISLQETNTPWHRYATLTNMIFIPSLHVLPQFFCGRGKDFSSKPQLHKTPLHPANRYVPRTSGTLQTARMGKKCAEMHSRSAAGWRLRSIE